LGEKKPPGKERGTRLKATAATRAGKSCLRLAQIVDSAAKLPRKSTLSIPRWQFRETVVGTLAYHAKTTVVSNKRFVRVGLWVNDHVD